MTAHQSPTNVLNHTMEGGWWSTVIWDAGFRIELTIENYARENLFLLLFSPQSKGVLEDMLCYPDFAPRRDRGASMEGFKEGPIAHLDSNFFHQVDSFARDTPLDNKIRTLSAAF